MINRKNLVRIMFLPAAVLLVPLTAMQFTEEVNWDGLDFVVAWLLMAGVGGAYTVIANRLAGASGDADYRAGAGVALGTAFVLMWMNLAVFAVGTVGALIARFEPTGMACTLATTALVQALVPLSAVAIWQPPFTWSMIGEFGLNTFFAGLFLASATLFQRAASHQRPHAWMA